MAAPVSRPLKFPRSMRLRQGRDFARVRQEGQRLVAGCLIANWRRLPDASAPRLGVVTGRRIGNATVRSRARRLLREVFRLHQHDLAQPVDLVLVARPSITSKTFSGVERDFLAVIRKTGLIQS